MSIIFIFWWCCLLPLLASYDLQRGISEYSTPSLVILGTAKGGTTDMWEMVHILHKGFASYSSAAFSSRCPCRIRPWKELMFFNDKYDFCYSADNIQTWCNVSELSTLLRCPISVFTNQSTPHRMMVSLCNAELQRRKVSVPVFTATASPLLLLLASPSSDALMKTYQDTQAAPLFATFLRDPTRATVSLYNHGMVRQLSHVSYGFAL